VKWSFQYDDKGKKQNSKVKMQNDNSKCKKERLLILYL